MSDRVIDILATMSRTFWGFKKPKSLAHLVRQIETRTGPDRSKPADGVNDRRAQIASRRAALSKVRSTQGDLQARADIVRARQLARAWR